MRINPTALCDVLKLDKTPNEYGEPRNTWTTVATGIWMEIAPILGRDFVQAVSMVVAIDAKVRGRWIDGVAPDMRIKDDRGRIWDIVSAIDVEDRQTELLCYVRQVRD